MANDSEINRYPLFVLLQVTGARPGAWSTDSARPGLERRTVQLRADVVEVLKGTQRPGTATFSVTQRRSPVGRITGDEGPWSSVDLEGRPRLVVGAMSPRALGSDDSLVIAENDPSTPHAAADIRAAVELSRVSDLGARLRNPEQLRSLVGRLSQSGPLLARYLIDVVPADALPPLLGAGIAPLFRSTLLVHLVQEVSLREAPTDPLRLALVRSMFDVLHEPGDTARALKDAIASVYLRNTLFDLSGRAYVQLAQLYPDAEQRRRALATLQLQRLAADQQQLFASWQRGTGPVVA